MADIHLVRDELFPPAEPARRHLISVEDLERDDVERLLATARGERVQVQLVEIDEVDRVLLIPEEASQ